MEKKKDIDVAPRQEADIMREKAENYLVCFIDSCPLRESCLRWVAGQYVDSKLMARTAINPRNPLMGVEGCPKYREKVCVKMMRGMTRFRHPQRADCPFRSQTLFPDAQGRGAYQSRRPAVYRPSLPKARLDGSLGLRWGGRGLAVVGLMISCSYKNDS